MVQHRPSPVQVCAQGYPALVQELRPVNTLRLLILTARFWPQATGSQRLLARLVAGLAQRGVRPTILTVRWAAHWPVEVSFHELPVVRLLQPPGKSWSRLRSARAVARWLARSGQNYHAAFVWEGTELEPIRAAARVISGRMPLVLRTEGEGLEAWQPAAGGAGRSGHSPAVTRLAVLTEVARRRLQATGWPEAAIVRVAEGVALPAGQNAISRSEARRMLAETNMALCLPETVPLVVALGRFDTEGLLGRLRKAWRPVVEQRREARLWLVGPAADWVGVPQPGSEVPGGLCAVGAFDDVRPLLAAADVCVVIGSGAESRACLLEALAAGRPIVASRCPEFCELVAHEQQALLVEADSPGAWGEALARLLGDPQLADRLAFAALRHAAERFSADKMVESHLALFESLGAATEQLTLTNRTDSNRS